MRNSSTIQRYRVGLDPAELGESNDAAVSVDAGCLLSIALPEGPYVDVLAVEIHDPSGSLASVPAPGRALATAVPTTPGDHVLRVRNDGAEPVTYRRTLILRHEWQ